MIRMLSLALLLPSFTMNGSIASVIANRCVLPVIGGVSSFILTKTGIGLFKKLNDSNPESKTTNYLFDERIQKMLKEKLKGKYPEDKPVVFGMSAEQHVHQSHQGTHYVFFPPTLDTRLGFFNALSLLLGLKQLNHNDILSRVSPSDIDHYLDTNAFVINHELGHLTLNHNERTRDAVRRVCAGVFGTSIVYNCWGILRNPGTLGASVAHGALMSLTVPLSLGAVYTYAHYLRRKQEREADDFAIKHATSPDQLQRGIALLRSHSHVGSVHNSDCLFEYVVQAQKKLFSTHPSDAERIEKLQRAIDTWDARNH